MPLPFLLAAGLAPAWTVVPTDTTANFRAISAPGGSVCWAAGSKGTFARTVDGKSWTTGQVAQAKDAEFRSITAFDADHAVMLAIGDGPESRVFRTEDGGKTWTQAWANPRKEAFFDALGFWDREHGIAFGDPVNGRFPIVRTDDGGRTWRPLDPQMPPAEPGEASFAASGQCLAVADATNAWIVTGGGAARVFFSSDRGANWTVAPTPVLPLSSSGGLFGLLPLGGRAALAVGGDYELDDRPGHLLRTSDGATWPVVPGFRPAGLREAAVRAKGGFVLVGPSGTDLSFDDGRTWQAVKAPGPLHTVAVAGGTVWAVGEGGLIARLSA